MKQKKNTPRQPKPVYTRKEPQGPRIIASKYVASAVRPDQYPEGDTVEVKPKNAVMSGSWWICRVMGTQKLIRVIEIYGLPLLPIIFYNQND